MGRSTDYFPRLGNPVAPVGRHSTSPLAGGWFYHTRVGVIMTGVSEFSLCYERPRLPDWPYNVFGMIHGQTEEQCRAVAARMAEATGISDYDLLFSVREFKKSSMVYT